ncbi:helix-turn-helix domain-containing protein [Allomesorhizobium camelthorni]|uniref:Helix-turn-helix transcriptional regulator n=1 Tax=Allomesorhizobium camelthorni TaxID=475069 RepID=A0A6G4WFV9_9HYPH|nr:helix-turn-helix transcriptional regulator [Mesorhizobium camelthorni]NGO53489.1 helix-turn-helix transcriptional regulator [Mesorhizobium camelthorni]
MKTNNIALDLKVARHKAGLRQLDCAHLLGVHKTRISNIENGRSAPTTLEVATLSLVYGKPMESLLAGLLDEVVDELIPRLRSIPTAPTSIAVTFNRTHTLSQLAIRLEALITTENGRA